MALFKIEDFNPNYRQEAFDGKDIRGIDVYAGNTDEKIGHIHNVLVDETGHFRYLVIDTGFWIFGKKVLLPVGRCYVDVNARRINAIGLLNKEQVKNLPEYNDDMTVDYDYEEQVRSIYRTPRVEASIPVEMSASVEMTPAVEMTRVNQISYQVPRNIESGTTGYDSSNYAYEQEPEIYNMSEQTHQKLKLYEEKLVANKRRQLAGKVSIGKRVETETATASVPIEKERVVIKRTNSENIGQVVTPTDVDFREGEVARIEVYEETADIQKQAFVREEVSINKETQQGLVSAEDTVRREELEVDVEGSPVVKE
ncbi:MAG: DUF2382 domain-containing protein [Nostocaceae cyanobacterium]|nr:DUF2382 domain-containing protein [Nostocaceae cyanobacterium]